MEFLPFSDVLTQCRESELMIHLTFQERREKRFGCGGGRRFQSHSVKRIDAARSPALNNDPIYPTAGLDLDCRVHECRKPGDRH
jgi:hypothetical protein